MRVCTSTVQHYDWKVTTTMKIHHQDGGEFGRRFKEKIPPRISKFYFINCPVKKNYPGNFKMYFLSPGAIDVSIKKLLQRVGESRASSRDFPMKFDLEFFFLVLKDCLHLSVTTYYTVGISDNYRDFLKLLF